MGEAVNVVLVSALAALLEELVTAWAADDETDCGGVLLSAKAAIAASVSDASSVDSSWQGVLPNLL